MQPLDVIAFKEGVHDQLPVRRARRACAGGRGAGRRGRKRRNPAPSACGLGEIGRFVESEPDQAASLQRRQALETEIALVEAGKCVGARQADQAAVESRRSRRDRGRRAAAAQTALTALDQPRAAVLADVEEDVRLAVAVAGDEQRLAEAVMRHGHVVLRQQGGRRDHERQAPEQLCLLGDMPRRIGIGGGIDMRDRRAHCAGRRGAAFRPGRVCPAVGAEGVHRFGLLLAKFSR